MASRKLPFILPSLRHASGQSLFVEDIQQTSFHFCECIIGQEINRMSAVRRKSTRTGWCLRLDAVFRITVEIPIEASLA